MSTVVGRKERERDARDGGEVKRMRGGVSRGMRGVGLLAHTPGPFIAFSWSVVRVVTSSRYGTTRNNLYRLQYDLNCATLSW
jgi:hypothetical protein